MLQILIHIIFQVFSKEIVYDFDANLGQQDYWVGYQAGSPTNFSACGTQIYGGYQIFSTTNAITRNFELPPHYRLLIELTFYRIDDWNSDQLKIVLDDQEIYSATYSNGNGQQLCGNSGFVDQIIQINIEAQHTSNLAVIYIFVIDNSPSNSGYWGIRTFKLSIEQCPYGCYYCESGSKLYCQQWFLNKWDKTINSYGHYPIDLYGDFSCLNCAYNLDLSEHNQLIIRFRVSNYQPSLTVEVKIDGASYKSTIFSKTGKLNMYSDFMVLMKHSKRQIQIMISNSGGNSLQCYLKDFQVLVKMIFEIPSPSFLIGCQNYIQNDCLQCQEGWQIELLSNKCLPKCDSIFWYLNDICQTEIETNDQKQSKQVQIKIHQTIQCDYGWSLNYITQVCNPICGDLIIVGHEECDDGNDIQFDGCFTCLLQCQLNCQKCLYGRCQQCLDGFQMDENNKCNTICGDGILVPYLEECEDNNSLQGDGCFGCKREECSSECTLCRMGECLLYQICGDKIVSQINEECDDGNDEQYDGCYNCKYECKRECTQCGQNGYCQDLCPYGQVLINDICSSICGNKIVNENEDCDDGNNLPYDGCHQCLFSCPQFCGYCYQGLCLECQLNYQLDENNHSCVPLISNKTIQLDDGSFRTLDVNSKNNSLMGVVCNNQESRQCFFQSKPQLKLTYLNSTFNKQYVQILFTQEVRLNNLSSFLNITASVINIPIEVYQVTISSITEASNMLTWPEYVICIEISQLIVVDPILQISLNEIMVNSFNLEVFNPKMEIKLKKLFI